MILRSGGRRSSRDRYNHGVNAAAVAEMLGRDREEWAALTALLDAHPGGPVHDPESPEWEARHVYAHFDRWMGHSTDDLEAVLASRERPRKPEGDDDTVNARWRAEDDAISSEEARRRAQEAFERRTAAVEGVPPERWDDLLTAIAHADGYKHIAGHRRYIEAAG
jgi:hypothetical protein